MTPAERAEDTLVRQIRAVALCWRWKLEREGEELDR
jgi:hypothetical protein